MNIDDIKERVTDIRERMPEVRDRIEAWREDLELPETQTTETAAGAVLIGSGIVAAIINLLGGKRDVWAWFLPAILLTGGAALLIAGALERREGRIDAAEAAVRAELDSLDPIARAKVLKEVAEQQLAKLGVAPGGAEA
ncbi:MAG: hypothetical protein IBX63_03730 [Coriobacteriia bacterium]|nr:hypothetical protein [Coriobacteriia bacterium]